MNEPRIGDFEHTRRLLERLNRLYAMLSHINRTIMRAESPGDIYCAACRIAVEDGNLAFAIIGLVDPQTGGLVSVGSAGNAPDLARLPLGNDGQHNAGFAGQRIYQGKPCAINDVRTEEHAAWAKPMLDDLGIRAIASFPLLQEKAVTGVLALGATEAGYFGDAELNLLNEIADDIAFATDALRRDEKRLANEAKMHYLAFYDARTGLPGRELFEERLNAACARHPDGPIAVLAMRLREYHGILQVLGHNAGAVIGRAIGTRLESQQPTALVGRLAENIFAIVLENADGLHHVEEIAWKLHTATSEGIFVDSQEVFVSPFIGIGLYPRDGRPADVLKAAMTAAGKPPLDSVGVCRFYDAEMDNGSRERLDLDTALRHANARKEFQLYFQPQVDIASGRVVGAEALLRWQRPNHGLVAPGAFIHALEESGLITTVGEWVLHEACRHCHEWQRAGLPPIRMAVNLSARQCNESDIRVLVRRALHNTGLDPQWLELEVTESIVLFDAERIIRTMQDLHSLGVSQALDDFGTGYSSLSYLRRLPVQRIKIDRSFVTNITSSPGDAAIVRAVVGMAHSLDLHVVAEGVETEGQLGYLRGLRCEEIQGYFFSPPLPANDFVALMRGGRSVAAIPDADRTERVLLIVDDEPDVLSALRRMLRPTGYKVLATTSPREAFEMLATNNVGVVISDQRMPEMTGTEFLRRVKALYPATVRIILSGYTELNSVIDAVNRGAIYKFLTKPWQDDALLESLDDAFHLYEVEHENRDLTRQLLDIRTAANNAALAAAVRRPIE